MIQDEREPGAWADPHPGRPIPFWEGVRADLVAHVPPEFRGKSRWKWAVSGAAILLRSSGLRVMMHYRLAHLLLHRGGPIGRILAGLIFWWVRHWYACSIAPGARLHPGIILPHPQGIVIGDATVGPSSWIFHNVTLGGAPGKVGLPRVGRGARIMAGAVLSGPIRVGDHVVIGANAVVDRDVPADSLVHDPPPDIDPRLDR